MWSISELKQRGKAAFKNNYWRCVVVGLILSSLTAGSTMTGSTGSVKNFDASKYDNETLIAIVAFVASIILIFAVVFTLVRILLLNPIEIGCQTFLKENINEKAALDRLFDDAKVITFKGESYRGRKREVLAVEAGTTPASLSIKNLQ